MSGKNRRQINKSKQKASCGEISSNKAIMRNLNSSDKKELPVFIPAIIKSKHQAKDIDIVIICADAYCAACRWKRAQVFTIFMRNIPYQAEKKARTGTNWKSVVSRKIHDFFDVFSKKNSNTFIRYQNYDYKIQLRKEQKHGLHNCTRCFLKNLMTLNSILTFI